MLVLRSFGRKNFGDTEGHDDSAGAIVNIRFNIAIQTKPNCAAAELEPRAKSDRALPGIAHIATVDLVVGQLLQPVPVKAKPDVFPQFVGSRIVDVKSLPWLHIFDSETNEWVVVS